MNLIWTVFGHAWWGLPALLAIVAGGFAVFGAWPLLLAALGRLPPKLQALLLAVVVALVAASGLYAVGRNHGHDSRDAEVAEFQRVLGVERESNRTNLEAIDKLVAANQGWANAAKEKSEAAEKAIAEVEAARARLAAEVTRLRREREKLYANDPDAAAWGRGAVPAGIADQLRAGEAAERPD